MDGFGRFGSGSSLVNGFFSLVSGFNPYGLVWFRIVLILTGLTVGSTAGSVPVQCHLFSKKIVLNQLTNYFFRNFFGPTVWTGSVQKFFWSDGWNRLFQRSDCGSNRRFKPPVQFASEPAVRPFSEGSNQNLNCNPSVMVGRFQFHF